MRRMAGGQTPLGIAASRGHASVVKLLLECNADPDPFDQLERTPFTLAARKGHLSIVAMLLERGFRINTSDV